MKCSICTLPILDSERHETEPKIVHYECLIGSRCNRCRWRYEKCAICKQCVDYDKHSPCQTTFPEGRGGDEY